MRCVVSWKCVVELFFFRETNTFLKEFFETSIISRLLWLPQSPDLIPADFFLWGFIKDQIFAWNPESIEVLEQFITRDYCRDDALDVMPGLHSYLGYSSRLLARYEWDEVRTNVDIHTLVQELSKTRLDIEDILVSFDSGLIYRHVSESFETRQMYPSHSHSLLVSCCLDENVNQVLKKVYHNLQQWVATYLALYGGKIEQIL